MRSLLPLCAALLLAPGCGGSGETRLAITVAYGVNAMVRYDLRCDPPGGDVPHPAALCALLRENADAMLTPFDPTPDSLCFDFGTAAYVGVRGIFEGDSVNAGVSSCLGNDEGEQLWRRELPLP